MISVIVPVHNGIKTLDRAVESVLSQSILRQEKVEILLIDDGSEGATAEKCDALVGEEQRSDCVIRTFHMEDRGVSAARNLGLCHAEGEFITFLDDDDAMEPGMLSFLLALHKETGADICGCGFRKVPADPDRAAERMPDDPAGMDDTNDVDAAVSHGYAEEQGLREYKLYRGQSIITDRILQRDTRVWSKLFTRKAIGHHRFLEGLTIGEDMLFVVSLVSEGTSYAAAETPLYDYTINPKGAMERPFTKSYMDQIRCWDEAEKVMRENCPDILNDRETAEELGALRIVSDILTASKIAKLPDEPWQQYQGEFELCRAKLSSHRKIPGSMRRIPKDYRVKAVLLGYFPSLYRRVYRKVR